MKPSIVEAMVDLLPEPGAQWDPFDRHRWMAAFQAVLELAYPRAGAPEESAKPKQAPIRVDVDPEAGTFTVERPLIPCPQCDKQFRSQQALSSHSRSHRLECEVCQTRFGSDVALANHRSRAHPAPEVDEPDPVVQVTEPEPEPEPVVAAPAPKLNPLDWARSTVPARPVAEPIARVPVDVDMARARAAAAI